MTDTYLTISEIAANTVFSQRVTACASQQGAPDPPNWTLGHRWQVAATPSFAASVDSWRAANPTEDQDGWAALPEVISDGMILAAVQPLILGATPDTIPDASSTRQERLDYLGAVGVHGVDALSSDELLDLIRDLADTP